MGTVHSAHFIMIYKFSILHYNYKVFIFTWYTCHNDYPGHVSDDISCIYIYIYIYAYTYICTHTYVYLHAETHTFPREHMHTHTRIHRYIYILYITLNQLIGAGRRLFLSVIWTIIGSEWLVTNITPSHYLNQGWFSLVYFNEILFRIYNFSWYFSMNLFKLSSRIWSPCCSGLKCVDS